MKKKLLGFGLACAMVASVGVISAGCCGENQSNIDAQNFYAMAAVSSVSYLQESGTQSLSSMNEVSRPSTISETDVNSIASYMDMFQGLLSSGKDYFSNGEVTENDEYYGTYNLKMTMSIPTITGETETFVMYYKEINTETKEEIDDNEIELEINTTLEGVITVGNETFNVSGMREYEKEGRETEVSIEFKTWSMDTPNDYVEIEHSAENDEIEYEYSIYKNNRLLNKTEVEYENERSEKKLELEFIDNSTEIKSEVKYELTQYNNNPNKYSVEVKNSTNENEIKETFTITVLETGYLFEYKNGFTETIAL